MASLFSLRFIKMAKVLALMVLFFLSSVQTSRTHFGAYERKTWVKQNFESYGTGYKSLVKGAADLAREVPSGPDPLHHNIHPPTRP